MILFNFYSLANGAQDPLPQINATKNHLSDFAKSPQWHKLMYYEKGRINGVKSTVDGNGFFFAKDGKTNPSSELIATLNAFYSNKKVSVFKVHPICAFPARFAILKKEFNLKIKRKCPKVDDLLKQFDAQSVSYVFSSAAPNNPGSKFGHTFLKFNSKNKSDLLQVTVNYAAGVAADENMLAFVYLGVAGGYQGVFSLVPYYVKIQEYNNSENRDLWLYELDLTEQEVRLLIKHIWELMINAKFDYYFFDENCSLLLLKMLEVVRPSWDISNFNIYVIPGESVKNLTRAKGVVRNVEYRPALQKQLYHYYNHLEESEKAQFFKIVNENVDPANINNVGVLEAAMSYFHYYKRRNKLTEENSKTLQKVRIKRSQLAPIKKLDNTILTPQSQPDLGHDSYRFSYRVGLINDINFKTADMSSKGMDESFFDLHIRSAYHDLLANDVGHETISEILFPEIQLRYSPNGRLWVEKATAVSTTSLFPLTFIESRPSWKLGIYSYTPHLNGVQHQNVIRADLGVGATLGFFNSKVFVYSLVMLQQEYAHFFPRGYQLGPGVLLGSVAQLHKRTKAKIELQQNWMFDVVKKQAAYWELSYGQSYFLSQNAELRLNAKSIVSSVKNGGRYDEVMFGLYHYFQ